MAHMLRSDASCVFPPEKWDMKKNETWLDWLISEGMESDKSIVN